MVSITLFFLLFSSTSALADYIQGHVVRIDRVAGTVDLVLCETCVQERNCARTSEEHLDEHGVDPATVRVVVAWLPRCLTAGMMVYARGEYSSADATRFEAVEVFPRRRMGGKDKTGVRSRFRHQRGQGHRQGHNGQ